MRVADEVRTRTCANSVGDPGVVGGNILRGVADASVGNVKRRPGRERSNTRVLPAAKQRMSQAASLEERQVVDVAEAEDMPLVEIGTCSIALEVVRVDESAVPSGRSVVDGVAVGIGSAHLKRTYRFPCRHLEPVINGRTRVEPGMDGAIPRIRTEERRTAAASEIHVYANPGLIRRQHVSIEARDGGASWACCPSSAITGVLGSGVGACHGLTGLVRIRKPLLGHRLKLIDIALHS